MNRRLILIPVTGLVLVTVAGCATTPHGTSTNSNRVTNSTPQVNTVQNSTANTSGVNAVSSSRGTAKGKLPNDDANEVAFMKSKGYSVNRAVPNASVQTDSGDTLTAWIGVAMQGDGHNQFVFFFLNGKYLGTDTAKPSAEITSAKRAGTGSIAVTYPVYKKNDSFANPTGVPDVITYHWNGVKLIPNKPYPKQFS